jgi:DNA-binding transcriptional LysR family regulator
MTIDLRALPTLDHLKGFAAAARHLSFTRAAAELFLTQSAISRQIQTLEEQLGVALFVREPRRLRLSAEGEQLQRTVDEVFRQLAETTEALRGGRRRPVTVSASIGISSLWLVPRLAAFLDANPEVDVRISANNRLVNLEREGIDLALRYSAAEDVPASADLLFGDEICPVGSPAYVGDSARLGLSAEALAGFTLLAYDGVGRYPWLDWTAWLQALGLAKAQPKAVLHFNHYDQMIAAAVAGQGLALGRGPLLGKLFAAGQLVALAGPKQQVASRAYYLILAEGQPRAEVALLRQYLLAQAAAERAAP